MRKILIIDAEKCSGCGACVSACREAAIGIVEGKARLIRDVYCDGLGSCLPECPEGALSIEEREAEDFDEMAGRLSHWPIQLKLVSPLAPFFKDSALLISADCAAYSYGNFHNDFMKSKTTLIGCPKLDGTDYSIKLREIFEANTPESVTVARMEQPCCAGIAFMTEKALKDCGKDIKLKTYILSSDGKIREGELP